MCAAVTSIPTNLNARNGGQETNLYIFYYLTVFSDNLEMLPHKHIVFASLHFQISSVLCLDYFPNSCSSHMTFYRRLTQLTTLCFLKLFHYMASKTTLSPDSPPTSPATAFPSPLLIFPCPHPLLVVESPGRKLLLIYTYSTGELTWPWL